jgi:hypothetical protein
MFSDNRIHSKCVGRAAPNAAGVIVGAECVKAAVNATCIGIGAAAVESGDKATNVISFTPVKLSPRRHEIGKGRHTQTPTFGESVIKTASARQHVATAPYIRSHIVQRTHVPRILRYAISVAAP